jgi:hypothetical protein
MAPSPLKFSDDPLLSCLGWNFALVYKTDGSVRWQTWCLAARMLSGSFSSRYILVKKRFFGLTVRLFQSQFRKLGDQASLTA